jgi:hypothetical protein
VQFTLGEVIAGMRGRSDVEGARDWMEEPIRMPIGGHATTSWW